MEGHAIFPSDDPTINIIIPKNTEIKRGALYIGDINAASSPEKLKQFDIQAILTVASETQLDLSGAGVSWHKVVPVEDFISFDIKRYFQESIDFIDTNLTQGINVLVHCFAGVSRSSSIILAYLMKTQGMTFREAFNYAQDKRKQINPNPGFVLQLKDYENYLLFTDY